MALKMRKDIKKSSYYVWFLGAQESKGLRGSEYVIPVVKSLILRERNVEPFKVTLQVSHKGLKIIQNVPQNPQTPKSKKPEVVKHFIPHHAVTCVLQDVDIVSCILLLYNPVTKCPVHVHAYRCDSVETAEILKGQLQTLIERPENQKKLGEIETRLQAKGLLLPLARGPAARRLNSGGGSDGRSTSTRESESSGGSSSERLSGGNQERITSMYDSLAAELREKLGSTKRGADAPILLPPRDYDTVHRQKGNLTAIDLRRCLNTNIVGVNAKKDALKTKVAVISSGGSSGIGSDHAPSPDQVEPDQRYLDNQSTSDEEWTEHPSEDSLFLVQPGSAWPRSEQLSLPRARRLLSSDPPPSTPSTPSTPSNPPPARRAAPAEIRQRTPSPPRSRSAAPKLHPLKISKSLNNNNININATISKLSPRDRFKDAKEKFLLLERERGDDQKAVTEVKKRGSIHEMPISPVTSAAPRLLGRTTGRAWSRSRDSDEELEDRPVASGKEYIEECDDDIFEHGYPRKNVVGRENSSKLRDAYVEDAGRSRPGEEARMRKAYEAKPAAVRAQGKPLREREDNISGRYGERRGERYGSPDRVTSRGYEAPRGQSERRAGDYSPEARPRRDAYSPDMQHRRHDEYSPERKPRKSIEYSPERKPRKSAEYSPERKPRKSAEYSPERKPRKSPEYSPEKGPAERVLSPARNPRPTPRHLSDDDKNYQLESRYRGGRGQVISHIDEVEPVGRYRSPARNPLPTPRGHAPPLNPREGGDVSPEEQRRYLRGPAAYLAQEKKRRSMFDVMEDERRKSSNELAKEFKRRSYHDGGSEISAAEHSRSSNNNNNNSVERDYRSQEGRNENFDSNRRGGSHLDGRGGQVDLRGGRLDPRDMRSSNSIEARELRNNQNNHLDPRGGRGEYDPRDMPRMERGGRHGGYQEIADQERFPGLDRETARHVGNKNMKKAVVDARYRHSYAEPAGLPHHLSLQHHDMLHRTNSTVSSGRVGIAAVHPY